MIKAIRTVGITVFASAGVLLTPLVAANAHPLDVQLQSSPYKNCTEAWNDGGAPVLKGDERYGPHLDRDNDGIGCEVDPRK
ncbi:excalibur calcium-binding domain-containing protein [Antrihabitans stalactiti]|uniref:Excalibur calcium-binding domain-containing protein n=1 Tax=Antrihabitans stalactiti TaxID=2584121 RepID=A0A848KPC4_9NOCA|nr:excalibur calcium-binding domain-containing protein [Antrihabitans stalactiti]NMN98472.1 excalibur calcium-binding domain-containing protein [Antrihabitans stalactiti]